MTCVPHRTVYQPRGPMPHEAVEFGMRLWESRFPESVLWSRRSLWTIARLWTGARTCPASHTDSHREHEPLGIVAGSRDGTNGKRALGVEGHQASRGRWQRRTGPAASPLRSFRPLRTIRTPL